MPPPLISTFARTPAGVVGGTDRRPVSGRRLLIIWALTYEVSRDIVRVTPTDLWLLGVISAEKKRSDKSLGGEWA
jgi:hypothetical protein